MKIIAAGFTTALLIFVAASAMSEMLLTPDTPVSREKTHDDLARSQRGLTRSKRADIAAQESARQTANLQQKLSAIRQREDTVRSKQEALQIVFEEVREEQQSVDQLRRQVTQEIAALRDATVRVARRDSRISSDTVTDADVTRSAESRSSSKPVLAIRDKRTVQDTAVLVNRLAQNGSLRAATSLLRSLRDRDAAKVLDALAATDSQMALRLSQNLMATRDESSVRR